MNNLLISLIPCWVHLAIEYQKRRKGTPCTDSDDKQSRKTASMMIEAWRIGLGASKGVPGMVAPELKGAVVLLNGRMRLAIVDAAASPEENETAQEVDPVITRPVLQLAQMYLKHTTDRTCVDEGDDVARKSAQGIVNAWKEATRQTANLYHVEDPQLETVTLVKGDWPLMCGLSDAQQRAHWARETAPDKAEAVFDNLNLMGGSGGSCASRRNQ